MMLNHLAYIDPTREPASDEPAMLELFVAKFLASRDRCLGDTSAFGAMDRMLILDALFVLRSYSSTSLVRVRSIS